MGSTPQFGKAEYAPAPGNNNCRLCNQPLGANYYRVNGAAACESCAQKIKDATPKDSHAAFVRAVLFGIGGFVLGLVLYSGFVILTKIEIGFVSLAVGFIVAKAILMGSGNVGGRRYQILAVVLTYAAVSMAAIPIAFGLRNASPPASQPGSNQAQSAQSDNADQQNSAASEQPSNDSRLAPKMGFAAAIAGLALLGLASPFLELSGGSSGVIGLVILFVGLKIAWRMTAARNIAMDGPFPNTPSAPAVG